MKRKAAAGDRVIVFVKAPRPGRVKTRLAEAIGEEEAAAAYRWMLGRLLDNLASLSGVELRFTPDQAGEEIGRWLRGDWSARPQGRGDLGRRMEAAFGEAFANGAGRVVVIGSDCPLVERSDIEAAWEALGSNELVLGPARDGGYWLIGLTRNEPVLFRGMRWSQPTVLRRTLERARRRKLRICLLRELADVDRVEDWRLLF